ncbi:MAG: hypothetical protein GW880_16320, partial [Armatimonadetes bacterium]|nr:hypothetical protein [Armatimonadota bacterium]
MSPLLSPPALSARTRFAPLVLACLLVAVPRAWCQPQELAGNPGMESGKHGGPPEGWVANSYGELVTTLSWDADMAHTGKASLRLQCQVFRGGAAQAYLPVDSVRTGETYTLRAWMRGERSSAPAQLLIRDIGPPYHNYLGTSALVTGEWRPVVAIGKADAGGNSVGLFVNFQSAGTLWLDDLSLSVGEH